MNIKTVRLELLRPGPPHNQLLSPLTEYIALCGDEPPETFRVPFEHYRILRSLQGLRSVRSPAEVDATVTELREDVVRMLSGIRCLATSLAEAHGDGAEVIELELVLSAAELSLIPFEIAFYPGSPTRELAHREVIVMRRSRRVPRSQLWWEHRPRILVVGASPPGFEPVPIQAHVDGIREALAPWLAYLDGYEDREVILHELKKFMVVLPNASELSIQEAIKASFNRGPGFTHLHIVAHGGEIAADDENAEQHESFREPRFGLVLHDSRSPERRDTLSGRRLFSALAGSDGRCGRRLPQVVTLASCESGNVGNVVVPGASVAHDIHDGGVPLVVASQFPLSYRGSVVFVKRLYEQLLAGDDPRCGLRETRRSIHSSSTRDVGPVDWGAIVQYGALPTDLAGRVAQAKVRALKQRIDAAVSSVDVKVNPPPKSTLTAAWKQARDALDLLEPFKEDVEVDRYIARVHLRWAFVLLDRTSADAEWNEFIKQTPDSAADPTVSRRQSLFVFRDGLRRHYRATRKPVSLIDSLVGDFFLDEPIAYAHALTAVTEASESLLSVLSKDARRKLERALIELWILAPAISGAAPTLDLDEPITRAVAARNDEQWFERVLDRQFADAAPTDYEYFAHRRQVERIERMAATFKKELIVKRAQLVVKSLIERGVLARFSAIVDWIEQPDGGRRTVAT